MLYKKVDGSSADSISSGLDFFSTPPTNSAISNSSFREYLTLNPISSTPFNFKIHPITSFIDLSKIYILTECRIKKVAADGVETDLPVNEVVAPIQLPGATWIKNLKVLINQREIYSSNQLYSYKAFLDTELSFPIGAKDSYLNVAGYQRDKKDPDSVADDGYVGRKNMFKRSGKVQLISRLSADIMNQDLYLISNVEMDIEITPQTDDFMIQQNKPAGADTNKYKFEITDVRLLVKTIDVMDGLSLDIARRLDHEPARYGIKKTSLKSLSITAGRSDFTANIFTDEVPRRVVLGLVSSSRYIGDKYESPFKFTHFNVRDIELTASGRIYPQYPYNLDYANDDYARAFHDTMEHLGFANTTESNGISYSMFKSGWNIYVFNLTNSQEDSQGFELVKDGSTTVNIRFSTPVPTGGITLLAYAESDGLILIDRNRTITSDLTV